jgi:trehalose 6-phosphate synthase
MAWTRERLETVARERFGGARLIVVANREPYIHTFDGEALRCTTPASGLTTALDPVMQACGGTWVAHGSGDGDRAASDNFGRVAVPPHDPSYTLRRVWLTKEEEQGYYYGFSNEAFWPLCHIAYARPRFDSKDWEQYVEVNRKFSEAVLEEAGSGPAVVFIQDYHFALLPRLLRTARPDLVIVQFWHIPWPNREAFRVCPGTTRCLTGCSATICCRSTCRITATISWKPLIGASSRASISSSSPSLGTARRRWSSPPDQHRSGLRRLVPAGRSAGAERRLRNRLHLHNEQLLVGVDRVDYTKGIPERFRAVGRLLELHPDQRHLHLRPGGRPESRTFPPIAG